MNENKVNVRDRKNWTIKEMQTLLALLVAGTTKANAAEKLGRPVSSLQSQRAKLVKEGAKHGVEVPRFERPKGVGGSSALDLSSLFVDDEGDDDSQDTVEFDDDEDIEIE